MSATKMGKTNTPISYYGGKQKLADKIVSLFPAHNLYCEPFLGGGAVFFRKEPSNIEVINDTNQELINFYEVVQKDFVSLEKEVKISLHARDIHRKAKAINENPDLFDKIKRAWAVWVLSAQSFASKLDGTWGYDRNKNETARKVHNKRENFTEELAIRLQEVQIECTDALRIIYSRDSEKTFFYLDPPYIGTHQGHYDGYTEEDHEMLLKRLEGIEGKFLLSSYPNDYLKKFVDRNGWYMVEMKPTTVSVATKQHRNKKKVEVLAANYPIT